MPRKFSIPVLLVVVGALVAAFFAVRSSGPGGDGVLARFEAPNGESFLVSQKWNNWTEPYTVSLFARTPGGRWGWCYIDHQSQRLQDASITLNAEGNAITICSDGKPLGRYDMAGSTFSLLDTEGRIARTVAAPQEWRDPSPQYLR
jgi:hypothetical protein